MFDFMDDFSGAERLAGKNRILLFSKVKELKRTVIYFEHVLFRCF